MALCTCIEDLWADSIKACEPVFPLRVSLFSPSLQKQELQSILEQTQTVVDQQNDFPLHRLNLEVSSTDGVDYTAAMSVKLQEAEVKEPTAVLNPALLELSFSKKMLAQPLTQDSPLISYMVQQLLHTFIEERAALAHLLPQRTVQRASGNRTNDALSRLTPEFERRRTRSMKYAPTYHVTFSILTPEAVPSDWEVESALGDAVDPLLKGLSLLYNFTVDTQVQPYSAWSPSVQPVYDAPRKSWVLQRSDLQGFINAAEWPLSPNIRPGPTLNFILYVSSKSKSPLLVEGYESNSWLIPQWGSVVIYNPPSWEKLEASKRLKADELYDAFWIFSQNLISLLGLPATQQPTYNRILSQMRLLSLDLINSASSTLGATARLTESLPSISIPKNVANSVDNTLEHLGAACDALKAGKFQKALDHAKIAEERSDKAFFDKSMVGQVYFPEEHKVAVYLPLLGPVAVPLILSAVKELRMIINARKHRK